MKDIVLICYFNNCMKRFISGFIFVICFLSFSAQSDEAQVLLRYPTSKKEAVFSGRQFIHEHLLVNDTGNVSKILDYLLTLENNDYLVFYPEEILLYNYWTGNYKAIFAFIAKYDSTYISNLYRKKYYPSEQNMKDLIEFSRKRRYVIYNQIESDKFLNVIDKDFLKLNFDQQLSWGKNKDIAVDSLNSRSKNFIDKYPQSGYDRYLMDYVGVEVVNKRWVFSGEYYAGAVFYLGKLNNVISPVLGFGVTPEIRYRRFALKIIDCFGFTVLKDTVHTKKVTWEKGTTSLFAMPGITLGYYVLNKQKLKLCPFAGLAGAIVAPFKGGFESPVVDSYGLIGGISIDFFLRESRMNDFNWMNKDHHYTRLTYTFYQAGFKNEYPVFNSSMHNLTIGFVMQSNPQKRIK